MATYLEESEKEVQIDHLRTNRPTCHLVKKIGRVDPEIICLREIIKKDRNWFNANKTYSPSGKFAELAG